MANETEILQAANQIFFVKGDDVVPMMMSKTIMIDETNPRAVSTEFGSGQIAKKLIDDGYELAIDDGSEEGKRIKKIVSESDTMKGRSFDNLEINEGIGKKLFRGVTSIGGKFRGKLPGVLGLLDIMGMKREYEQILAGEHPILNAATGRVQERAGLNQVYKDGGLVGIKYLTRKL
jgi:hypothetical protein